MISWLLELLDILWIRTVKRNLLLPPFTQEWFLHSSVLKPLQKLTKECFNYFLSFLLSDKEQKWLLKAESINPSERAAVIWFQCNLHDQHWLRRNHSPSQWDNKQMNWNSRLVHLTKNHRSAKQNVFMNEKANGVRCFFLGYFIRKFFFTLYGPNTKLKNVYQLPTENGFKGKRSI